MLTLLATLAVPTAHAHDDAYDWMALNGVDGAMHAVAIAQGLYTCEELMYEFLDARRNYCDDPEATLHVNASVVVTSRLESCVKGLFESYADESPMSCMDIYRIAHRSRDTIDCLQPEHTGAAVHFDSLAQTAWDEYIDQCSLDHDLIEFADPVVFP